jgi:subtilisin family serine protease
LFFNLLLIIGSMKITVVSSILLLVTALVAAAPTTNARVLSDVVDDSPAGSWSGTTAQQHGDPNRYMVVYRDSRIFQQASLFADSQVRVELPEFNAVAVTIPPEAVAGLRDNPNIESIEPDALRFSTGRSLRANHDISSLKPKSNHDSSATSRSLTGSQETPYGIYLVQADQVPMGSSFTPKICVIDSGYDLDHEDLPSGAQVTGDSDIDGAGEWFEDGNSHGTHVAGAQIFMTPILVVYDTTISCWLLCSQTVFAFLRQFPLFNRNNCSSRQWHWRCRGVSQL